MNLLQSQLLTTVAQRATDAVLLPIEAKVASGDISASDVADMATKVSAVANGFTSANLTHSTSMAAYGGAVIALAVALAPLFPQYAEAIKAVAAAVVAVITVFVVKFARKPAVANAVTSAALAGK